MNTELALKYLAMGLKPGQVATIVGVSPGRISQLLALPATQEFLASQQKEVAEEKVVEGKELAAKHALLDSLISKVGEATFMEVARAYEVISRAQATKNPIPIAGTHLFQGAVVQISMPARALESIEITKDKEVIAIGDRALAPLPAAQVTNLFERMRNEPICLPSRSEEGPQGTLLQAQG